MFFFGIFGIQDKEKILRNFSGIVCPNCDKLSRAELITSYRYLHFFFIPVFKWNKKYYVLLRCCKSLYEANEMYAQELKTSDDIDFSKLYKVTTPDNICPGCGNYINPAFNYCPFCGQQLY